MIECIFHRSNTEATLVSSLNISKMKQIEFKLEILLLKIKKWKHIFNNQNSQMHISCYFLINKLEYILIFTINNGKILS